MAAPNRPTNDDLDAHDDDDALLDAEEAGEEIIPDDNDHPMDSGDEDDGIEAEIELQNDSVAHFDAHKDSLFAIAAHPLDPSIVATGSGDDTAHVFQATGDAPLLPSSYESNPQPKGERKSLTSIAHLTGHTDSVSSISFSLPDGAYLLTAGLDGRIRAYSVDSTRTSYEFLGEAQEVEEISWLKPCPHPSYPNTFAVGASDGSVWVYTIDASSSTEPLAIVQTFYQHQAACTAGAWSPSGALLATVSEEGSLYVYDPFGEAAAAGVASPTGQAIVALTPEDQRFAVEGGLYSVAIAPSGAFLACGGAEGMIRIVGLPQLGTAGASATKSQKGAGSKFKAGGGKQAGGTSSAQAGQILASLQAQADSIETLSFSSPPLTLLAAGSVDGSITLFDTAHRFAVRRLIREAHEDQAVVQVEFARGASSSQPGVQGAVSEGWVLTSAGMDGVLRRWDTRGGTAAAGGGLIKEFKGHRGGGEGGGIMGFVQGGGKVVTAGDDYVSLVFDVGGA